MSTAVQPGIRHRVLAVPAQNATGNYVKIVQRVPVKIVMDDPPTDVTLGPGMSWSPFYRLGAIKSMSAGGGAIPRGRPAAVSGAAANPSGWIGRRVALASFMEVLDPPSPTSRCPISPVAWG